MKKDNSKTKPERISMQINFFGPLIKKEDIPKILDLETTNTTLDIHRTRLESFFDLSLSALSKKILERYIEITTQGLHMTITPHTQEIYERLLKPLSFAKKSYCLGDYLSTIALCGLVGEMLAILIWKYNEIKMRKELITEDDEKKLFDRSFEKLGQRRKLNILKTFKQISEQQYGYFKEISGTRNHYLHLWAINLKNEKKDALGILKNSFQLLNEIIGINLVTPGAVSIKNPLLLKFLKKERKK